MGQLLAAIGDIHGRFRRVEEWLRALGEARRQRVELALAVGDLETFTRADAPLRKRVKRDEPAEFGPYARGERRLPCPLWFIGGNNEDFAALYGMPEGGALAPEVRYLGRAGATALAGVRVGFLSGIFAPSSYDRPLEPPTNLELARRAGHFRASEVARAASVGRVDLLLLHDWPRGISRGGKGAPPAYWGNAPARSLVEALHPDWVLCGHQHRAWAANVGASHVACLADAERPETGLLWIELDAGKVASVGRGVTAEPVWRAGEAWPPRSG